VRARRGALLAAIAAAAIAACAHAPAPLPPPRPQAPRDGLPPRVAVVLGGGAARGFAHVGVLRALEDARVPIELLVGTSVGSLVAAIYADGRSGPELEAMTKDLRREDFFDFSIAPALFGNGLAKGERLLGFVRERVRARRIEELRIPYAAIATDLDTGEVVVLDRGEVAVAVRASASIPGVFEPVRDGGRVLVDGGVVANLPVRAARSLGADVVIAVDVTAVAGRARTSNFVEVILRAVNLVADEGVARAAREADVLVRPEVGALGLMDFDARDEAVRAGYAAGAAAIPEIRRILSAWRPRAAP
jgi:NTE family protein